MTEKITAQQLARKCLQLAREYRTVYVMGCFGAPMTEKNKKRYISNHSYNKQPQRTAKIQAATADTFGFDCVCMIKGLLWGWSGDREKTYGGATYRANGVPDIGANSMIKACSDVTEDFSGIQPGEAVWMPGHIGIYVGDGLVAECTPAWDDGVQLTACNCRKPGYHSRTWVSHGKLPYVDYGGYTQQRFRMETALVLEDGQPMTTLSMEKNRVHILVCLVQKYLKSLGYAIGTADGVFGQVTKEAVMAFQRDRGCVADGEITAGGKTWRCLLGEEAEYNE